MESHFMYKLIKDTLSVSNHVRVAERQNQNYLLIMEVYSVLSLSLSVYFFCSLILLYQKSKDRKIHLFSTVFHASVSIL